MVVWQIITFAIYGVINLVDMNGFRFAYFKGWPWFLVDYLLSSILFFYGFAHVVLIIFCIKIGIIILERYCGLFKKQSNYTYNSYGYNTYMSTFDW